MNEEINATNDTNNEVARLRWEIKISEEDGITPYLWDNRKYDNYDLGSLCRILNEYEEKTNEVARLRELLNRNGDELNTFHHTKEEAFALAEKAMPLWECVVIKRNTSDGLLFLGGWQVTTSGYRPAPEEAVVVNPEPSSSVVDQKPDNVSDKHEWRELGPDEVIHTGDEVQAKHHDRLHGVWLNVLPYEMGAMPIDHEAFRYRTRRPLPKQEGEQPYCSRCKYNHAFPCEGSIAGVPLEDELSAIEDSEGWDGGSELSRIEKAYNRVLNERKAEESASPDNEVAGLREENQKIRHAYLKSVERDDFLTQENAHLRAVIKTLLWFTEPHPLDLDDINLWDKIESIYGPAEGILELADFTEKEAR